jgi:hypothetical protein
MRFDLHNKVKNIEKRWASLLLFFYVIYLIALILSYILLDLTLTGFIVTGFFALTIFLIIVVKFFIKQWTPLRYLIFYWLFFSFLISLIVVDLNREVYEYGTLVNVGLFNFKEKHYGDLLLVTTISIVAIVLSMPLGVRIRKTLPNFLSSNRMFTHSNSVINFYIVATFYVILMLTAYMFDLGSLTKITQQTFDFPLIGGIVYARNIVFPILLAFSIQAIVNRFGYVSKKQWLVLIILAFIFTLTASSKKGLIYIVAPLIIYNVLYMKITIRIVIVGLVSILLFFPVMIYVLDVVRFSHYKDIEFSFDLLLTAPRNLEWTSFLSLMVDRLVGLKELMSVIALDDRSFYLFFNRENLIQDLYGFQYFDKVKALSHSLFGYFYVSGSYIFTFFGVFLVFVILSVMDSLFTKSNTRIVGTYISVIMFFDVFGGQVPRMLTITFPIIFSMVIMYGLVFVKYKIRFKSLFAI